MLIERDAVGLRFGSPSYYMNGEEWRPLYFDNLYVGPENVLLGAGGFRKQMAAFNTERLGNSARALAVDALIVGPEAGG